MEEYILEKAKYWATQPVFDHETQSEISKLLEEKNEKELVDRFYKDLEFGTGGLRGILGAGTAFMNRYNVQKATCALVRYVQKMNPGQTDLKIAISHDSRHFSRDFAKIVAEVAGHYGFKIFLTEELRPVPMLSFLTRFKKCNAGVCITASHNPPNYNGYKVYWSTGGQLVPPHDQGMIEEFDAIKDYAEIESTPFDTLLKEGQVEIVGKEFDEVYFTKVDSLSLKKEGRDDFKVVYTPLHGSGLYPVTTCLKRFGFKNVYVVPEQEKPDGSFPTVESPNPENQSALELALNLAKKMDADLVLGTDPDCDRVGIVVKDHNDYVFLNGNQLGCVLIYYYLSAMKEEGRLPENPLVIKTIVTTELQDKIANFFGADCEDTLTGFKWICDRIEAYESGAVKPYKKFVCGGEESYGFMADTFVRDKDGVVACCIAAEMTAYYKHKGQTLTDVLDEIFRKFGVYQESLLNVVLPGKEGADKIKSMMDGFRQNPPKDIDGIPVARIADFSSGKVTTFASASPHGPSEINLPASNVLQFFLEDGSKISVRPSGTEPKIKFYVSVHEKIEPTLSQSELEKVKTTCHDKVTRLEKAFSALAR